MAIYRAFANRNNWILVGLLIGAALSIIGCSATETPVPCPETKCPETKCPDPVSYEDLWTSSAHADSKAEAFTHWDEDDPLEIPEDCAKCHSKPGFLDFLGVDGTMAGRVDNAASVGTTVTCFVCHNEEIMITESVTFPSGVRISGLGSSAVCMQCHQGRESTGSVNEATAGLDVDVVSDTLAFINVHYFAAGATIFGTEVKGAYEYDGKSYRGRFLRADELFACVRCHDQHSLEVKTELCGECHTSGDDDIKDIRVDTTDYDGDGDIGEGIAYEIEAIHQALYEAIQAYANRVTGSPISYDAHTYPYFFIDTDANGEVDTGEAVLDNRYSAWTPRLLRAAYNYQFVSKDPGAFTHNSDYILQALYDSLADIGGDISQFTRPGSEGD